MQKPNAQYLSALREQMKAQGLDAVVINSTDPHQSEIPAAHWRGREWLTGFASENGTNGIAVITTDKAYVWTDSRFFIQATQQLEGTGFEMMKLDGPEAVDINDWLVEHLQEGATVGIDGMTFSISAAQALEQELNDNGMKLDDRFDPWDKIWEGRPKPPKNKLFVHDEAIVGQTADEKIAAVMETVKTELANAVLLSALDDIAWTTNLRTAGDISFSPIFVSYLYLDGDRRVLFVDPDKMSAEAEQHLIKYNIEQRPYEEVLDFVAKLPKETRLLMNPAITSRTVYDRTGCTVVFGGHGLAKLKGVKNDTMLANFKVAMVKDGVALTKFFMEVEREFPKGKLTEMSLARRLRALRLADETCVDESFAPILGWNEHGAIVHYEPSESTDVVLEGSGLLLVDSGGQYTFGTTDITRTVALGTPTAEQKRDFTLVLKGMIALSGAVYPKGTRGSQLDVLARQYLWADGKAYYHGTGHGVGFFINCHEGPQCIRLNDVPVALEPGMVTSNEPGLYLEGKYGIRCENLIATVPAMTTEFGEFYRFETLTLYPFDLTLLDMDLMTAEDRAWLNDYHRQVREALTPHLTAEEAEWLAEKTREI